jgi:signal transduction histidine kinase
MTDPRPVASAASSDADLVARLVAHRTLGRAPRAELEWLAAHGSVEHWEVGQLVARKGEPVHGLYIILAGHVSHLTDQGGTWRKVMDWRAGDVTGMLPYSRMTAAPGNSVVEEPTELLRIPQEWISEMTTACPHVTAELVHVMVDRARTFKSSDLQMEKLASLGKLAAGLAHELNNPASAAAASAKHMSDALAEADAAARALGAAHLDSSELSLIERVRAVGLAAPVTSVLSPLERADREEAFVDWLSAHDVDESFAESLSETDVTLAMLDQLASTLAGDKLSATIRWIATGCKIRGLTRDIERAASRVHVLVGAVKRFTYMDQATAPVAVDVGKSLTDTLAVMGSKARGKSASLTVDAPADLPRVRGFGGELNQVWANLIDNALDAVGDGGRVTVTARAAGPTVVVRVTDDGPGIPTELQSRIYDPFFTTKPVGQGTGLGLEIVRQLVRQNDGRIDLESEPGRTEFRVSLPAME